MRLVPSTARLQLFCLCSHSVSELNTQIKRLHVMCHASVLTGSRATDACVLFSHLLVGCVQCEEHRAGRSVEDGAFNSSSLSVVGACSVENFERTHNKKTSPTHHTWCKRAPFPLLGAYTYRGVDCPLCISFRESFLRGVSRKTKLSQTLLVLFCGLGGLICSVMFLSP